MNKAKFLKTPILKNIWERLLLKIYPVLLFRFLEDNSEVAVCRPAEVLGKYIYLNLFPIRLWAFSPKLY